MRKFVIDMTMSYDFQVTIEAESEEEAEQKVRELDVYKTLMDCDFNICYVDEIKERSFPSGNDADFGINME